MYRPNFGPKYRFDVNLVNIDVVVWPGTDNVKAIFGLRGLNTNIST